MKTTIGQLFDVEYGQKEYENKTPLEGEDGDGILISSKGEDNGVFGFFDIKAHYKSPIITVPRVGTIGQAYLQEINSSVDNNCLVLLPKKDLTREELLQTAFQIRLNKWKYKYGRQITPDRLKKQEIVLEDLKKDWDEFEKQITPPFQKKGKVNRPKNSKIFKLKDLLSVTKGLGSYLEGLDEGKTPVISTQVPDAGVCGFYDIEPTFKAPAITIGRIMCNPSIQLKDFATVPDDMFVITPREQSDLSFLCYVSAVIKAESWRFNYSRKVTKRKLEQLDLPLPIKDGKIDFDYLREIAENSYGFKNIS